jgi:hypothetical protein
LTERHLAQPSKRPDDDRVREVERKGRPVVEHGEHRPSNPDSGRTGARTVIASAQSYLHIERC